MNNNRVTWGVVVLFILVTLVSASLVPIETRSQSDSTKKPSETPDLAKYPIADFNAPEPSKVADRATKKRKSKRYDIQPFVVPNPPPDWGYITMFDKEPVPPALPFKESSLVVMGKILQGRAMVSETKGAVFSEYDVQVENILHNTASREVHTGQTITVDRGGGLVRYANGQTILYLADWQDMPKANERYLFFLDTEDETNPNFRILTAYMLKDGTVTPLDSHERFREPAARGNGEFMKLVVEAKSRP